MAAEGTNGSQTAEQARERVAALIRQQRDHGANAISNVSSLLGCDGRFVILMSHETGAQIMFHGMSDDDAREMIAKAYQATSKLVVPGTAVSA